MDNQNYRGWRYASQGDYHRNLDPNWSYTPTYLKKMAYIRKFLNGFPQNSRILDAGCGEGVLVEEYSAQGWNIEGIDINYSSNYVRQGDILDLPYESSYFDVVLLLDVFEHLAFSDQPAALKEIKRVLKVGGYFLASIPNLAHLNSRAKFLMRGNLDRTDSEINHIGERPIYENIHLIKSNGFEIIKKKGITLTVPWIYRRVICRKPARYRWLHDWLDVFAYPSIAMTNIFVCKPIDLPDSNIG